MKTILSYILLFTAITTSFAQKLSLELNLVKGGTYFQNSTTQSAIIQTLNGQETPMTMSIRGLVKYKVTEVTAEAYQMDVTYEELAMKMKMGTMEMEFSSNGEKQDLISGLFKKLVHQPFYIKMTKTGKITEVKNIESLFDAMFNDMSNIPDEQKQQIRAQVLQAYGSDAFKGSLEMISAIFPQNKVAVGDQWKVSTRLAAGMTANVDTTYQLKNIGKDDYEIVGNGILKTDDKQAYVQVNGMPLKYDMSGTMVSDLKIDKNTGWVQTAKIVQNFKGVVHVADNPQIPGGMTIPMKVENNTSINNENTTK